MKTNTKKIMAVLAVVATMSFTTLIKAEEISLPVISKPTILEEGTQRELSKEQIAELLPWAKDSKLFLVDLLDSIQGNAASDKIERLTDGISSVVGESAPKRSELLMRYVLNRGLVLNKILDQEMNSDAVGSTDAKLRVLISSIEMAIKYYDADMSTLQKKSDVPLAKFGIEYFQFLNELNKSIFDASAQYQVQRASLEWFQWDLYRDVNNASYAPQIVKINNNLRSFPNKKLSDAQAIANIRLLKKVTEQLDVKRMLIAINDQIAAAEAQKEEEIRTEKIKAYRNSFRAGRTAEEADRLLEFFDNLSVGPKEEVLKKITLLVEFKGLDISEWYIEKIEMDDLPYDYRRTMVFCLVERLSNPERYLKKNESVDSLRKLVISRLSDGLLKRKFSDWQNRSLIVTLFGFIPTKESYNLLLYRSYAEDNEYALAQVKSSMKQIEGAMSNLPR